MIGHHVSDRVSKFGHVVRMHQDTTGLVEKFGNSSDVACDDAKALRHRLEYGHRLAFALGRQNEDLCTGQQFWHSCVANPPAHVNACAHAKCGDLTPRAIDLTVASDCQSCL